ncbi:MAG: hypothetical protein EOP06_02840 [Proteobacteria bacterium]|nr:MAG: hypothetical protein EOP06_02840 [Pseudomonadota bacterium]
MMKKYSSRFNEEELVDIKKVHAIIHAVISDESINGLSIGDTDIKVEEIEYEARDGFIPNEDNLGGYTASTLIASISGAIGIGPIDVRHALEKMVSDSEKEDGFDDMSEEEKEDYRNRGYEVSEDESVYYECRVMYQGQDQEGNLNFHVDAAINWEFPYFRDNKQWQRVSAQDVCVENVEGVAAALSKALLNVTALYGRESAQKKTKGKKKK